MIGIVGLGNSGENYDLTRHNAGFLALDALAKKLTDNSWEHSTSFFDSDLLITTYAKEPIILLKPGTYVNESGPAVQKLLDERNLDRENLWIVHDDTEIPFGEVRVKFGGSSGGHNGIKSIDQALEPAYWRIRIGVGRPAHPGHDLADYVLGKFSKEEQDELPHVIDQVTSYLVKSISNGKLETTTFKVGD